MKKSVAVSCHIKQTNQSRVAHNPVIYIKIWITLTLALLLTTACVSESSNEKKVDSRNNKAMLAQQDAADIEDKINNSYARLAAKRVDVCPKLLQKEVDSNVIERVKEVMVSDHCNYYLYRQVNQRIAVSVNNDQVEALLIVPTIYNFANGDYQVSSYDKHVIRLAYEGVTYKPGRFNYDVAIEIIE